MCSKQLLDAFAFCYILSVCIARIPSVALGETTEGTPCQFVTSSTAHVGTGEIPSQFLIFSFPQLSLVIPS